MKGVIMEKKEEPTFRIVIEGIGDHHPDEEESKLTKEEREVMKDLDEFLKKETRDFHAKLQEKVKGKKFSLSSFVDNIRLTESNDKYPR